MECNDGKMATILNPEIVILMGNSTFFLLDKLHMWRSVIGAKEKEVLKVVISSQSSIMGWPPRFVPSVPGV